MTEQEPHEMTPEELAKIMADMTPEERLAAAREALAEEQPDAASKAFRELMRGGRGLSEERPGRPRRPSAQRLRGFRPGQPRSVAPEGYPSHSAGQ